MPGVPNKLSKFWQELKRRRVHRMLAIYAGSAYIVFEASTLIFPRWGLPDWTIDLVLYLLILGAIITFVVSWIYDVTPEGIQKTKPISEVQEGEVPITPNGWKIASYISIVVIVGLIMLNIIPRASNKKILDKSIAVLPFRNDSPDQERMYFINGTMEAILDNLCKIEDLRVPGRTSVEQYRDNPKPIPVVAEEMNVSYVLEGSGHRDGNNVRLFVQLLDGRNDQHLWSKSYDTDIEEIFSMQSEIAQLVAAEIEAIITPEEKQLIEEIPTTSLTALDFYLLGTEKLYDYWLGGDSISLVESENYLRKALEYDPTYALAYARLAWIYIRKSRSAGDFLSDNYLDSTLIMADKALSFNNKLAEAYDVKGNALNALGKTELGIKELEKAIKYNPNFFEPYMSLGSVYSGLEKTELAIHYLYHASILHRGEFLPFLFRRLAFLYLNCGFPEQARFYNLEALQLDKDTTQYFYVLAALEANNENYLEAMGYLEDAYVMDTSSAWRGSFVQQIAYNNHWLGRFEESLKYYKKLEAELTVMGLPIGNHLHRIGYVYFQLGMKEEADFYFDEEIRIANTLNELERPVSQSLYTYYDLAGVYAFRGEKDRAYENLRIFNQKPTIPKWMVILINNDPLFDSIRDEPEFQQIVRDVEAKYQAEHERVRQWLEENDML